MWYPWRAPTYPHDITLFQSTNDMSLFPDWKVKKVKIMKKWAHFFLSWGREKNKGKNEEITHFLYRGGVFSCGGSFLFVPRRNFRFLMKKTIFPLWKEWISVRPSSVFVCVCARAPAYPHHHNTDYCRFQFCSSNFENRRSIFGHMCLVSWLLFPFLVMHNIC